jgi:hypothetical protein
LAKYSGLQNRQNSNLSLELIRNCISSVKGRILEYERILEQLTYLYQVYQLELQVSGLEFSKISRLEFLAVNSFTNQNVENTERLLKRLTNLGFW